MADTNYPSATPTNVIPVYPAKKSNTKNILIGVLAAGLLGTWGYFLYDKNKAGDKIENQSKQITELSTDKSELQQDFDNALARLDSVTGANNNLSGENAEMQAKYNKDIDAKKAEIRRILNDKNATTSQSGAYFCKYNTEAGKNRFGNKPGNKNYRKTRIRENG
jgi:hypothetical protein